MQGKLEGVVKSVGQPQRRNIGEILPCLLTVSYFPS